MSRDIHAVGLYARISLDRQDGGGVARQIADCRQLTAERWPKAKVLEYVDNDMSAFHGKRRPEYERLLADVRAATVGAVVVYHADRLYRHPKDLEAFIDAVQAAGAEVATVKAGDIDLSAASGRMIARILGSVSRHESERMGERISRAKRERASQGRHPGGGFRPFGLTADRTAVVETEAAVAREVAARIIAGETWYSEVMRLNAAGVLTPRGNQWGQVALRRALTSPHIVGLKTYRGEIVGDAEWPAVLDRETWAELRQAATGRKTGRRPSGRYLLTGMLQCHICGRPLFIKNERRKYAEYRCTTATGSKGQGCGRTSVSMSRLDDHIRERIRGWLADPGRIARIQAWFAGYDDIDTAAELGEIERRLVKARQWWTAGDIDDPGFEEIQGDLNRRRALLAEQQNRRVRPKVNISAALLADTFDNMTVPEQRAVVAVMVATPIVVGPGREADGTTTPIDQRVNIRAAWE